MPYNVTTTGAYLTYLPYNSWVKYPYNEPPNEKPPLPPFPSNSKGTNDPLDGSSLDYVHHLIRDFMFADAVFHYQPGDDPTLFTPPPADERRFRVKSIEFDPEKIMDEDPNIMDYTRGTGFHNVDKKYLVELDDIHNRENLKFLYEQDLQYTAKYYQLTDLTGAVVTGISEEEAPNWFGVAVPSGITDFSNVIIYFHASPAQVTRSGFTTDGWNDADYPERNGDSGGPHWKELFGYVDRLGTQMVGTIKRYRNDPQVEVTPNQIVIVPFMPTALCNAWHDGTWNSPDGSTYPNIGSAGILTDQWYYIVNDIIQDLYDTLR